MPRDSRTYEEANHGKNRPGRKPGTTADVLFSGWANYNFTEADRGEYETWEAEGDTARLVDAIQQSGGLKLTLVWQDEQDCYLATAFCRKADSPNAGRMTSQRSSSSLRALLKLCWAIGFRMRDDWAGLMTQHADNW